MLQRCGEGAARSRRVDTKGIQWPVPLLRTIRSVAAHAPAWSSQASADPRCAPAEACTSSRCVALMGAALGLPPGRGRVPELLTRHPDARPQQLR